MYKRQLSDGAIGKLVGTTKPTIQAIRERTHWNINNITPIDPVALGLCKQSELDTAVQAAARKKAAEGTVMTDDERRKLVSTEQSLGMGPEGGFTDAEVETCVQAGVMPVSLGPRILRAETAGSAALALLQHRFGDL